MKSQNKHTFLLFLVIIGLLLPSVPVAFSETLAWWRFEDGTDGAELTSVKDFGSDGVSEGSRSGGNPQGSPTYIATNHSLDINSS